MKQTFDSGAKRYRDLPGRRWLTVIFRTIHLVGVVGVGASVVSPGAVSDPRPWTLTLGLSGVAMMALDAYANPVHFRQLAGLGQVLKLGLVAALVLDAERAHWWFWLLLVYSGVLSHAPGSLRHRELGRRAG